MTDNVQLRKALDAIALNYSEGKVSSDTLIKACENYKIHTGFVENIDYDIQVAKSVFDYINNVTPDEEISKAIVPGQTKVIDGVMYIYSATKNGSKTEYDWHVVKTGAKTGAAVGRGNNLSDAKIQAKQKYVNQLFPKDISSLKIVKKLGGSTGAQLVEDVNGNRYVMKKASNTNADHVRAEYLANQIYSALGQRTPDYELYEDANGDPILLSRYIPLAQAPTSSNYGEMAKGFIADCLLANWDVYQNDNCLVDNSGRIFRVDNGGCLNFRAKGSTKTFDGDILKTFDDMRRYNTSVYNKLDEQDILNQITEVKKHRDDVVNYLIDSGQDKLAKIIGERFDNLKHVESKIQAIIQKHNRQVLPRTLKSKEDMYAELDDDVCNGIYDDLAKIAGASALYHKGNNGWELLSRICQQRGFDARPRVVDEDEFWKLAAKSKQPIMFRGVGSDKNKSADDCADEFRYNDDCYYGRFGIYSEGIYAHVDDTNKSHKQGQSVNNHSNQSNYTNSNAWNAAKGYGTSVLKLAYEPDANIVELQDLIRELKANPPVGANTPKIKALKDEVKKAEEDWHKAEEDLKHFSEKIEQDVYTKMHYNVAALQDMHLVIDHTDWGKTDVDGTPMFPSWDEFVVGKMSKWIRDNGGKATQQKDTVVFELPNSSQTFVLSEYTYSSPSAIKKANQFSIAYNYAVKRFENWVAANHENVVEKAVKFAIKNSDDDVANQQKLVGTLKAEFESKQNLLDTEAKKSIPNKIYSECYRKAQSFDPNDPQGLEVMGIYAAMKGYDGIYRNNGNQTSNGFAIILNRSKIICSKK